ncbi:MAG: peptide-methionine (S)-S-oxide reductase MsrA [Humidesulfovibrio sp.]|uniref:peptide-methionine (S)-S-oxide reductase MsrA n=1 Tax=Humidesulfovibrio sp. TaxID=2910988 RepID=UPI002733CCED|nr:peptide-methionine (S)-S-oxide reductase MsrA [Humidesulfovibrio sp.]MDP2847693.1 peptide-methionine (S)-S-oxide reductase MsrA [Humidesulfovibrio sp.]
MNLDAFPAATFAGGCFWCLEADLLHLPGILSATSGYTGGDTDTPTYDEVCQGDTGHFEAVQARFDPELVDYRALVDWFWRRIDPTNGDGQFCDHGPQYRPAVFFHDADQEREALASKTALESLRLLPRPVAAQILPAEDFHPAEFQHQEYSSKNPRRYQLYRMGCGRDSTLARLWGREVADPLFAYVPRLPKGAPPEAELRKLLSPEAYRVAREDGTEPAFQNEHHAEHRPGLYVDPVNGAPLFASLHKYDSGTGWPSFTRPLMPGNIVTRTDRKLLLPRTEVRTWHSGIHLGHVFDDGPRSAGGLRYCLNSAALRFIPATELAAAGYGRYAGLF